jgi:hypothetical protein
VQDDYEECDDGGDNGSTECRPDCTIDPVR